MLLTAPDRSPSREFGALATLCVAWMHGCGAPPQPTTLAGTNLLPGRTDYLAASGHESWFTVSPSDWRVKAIDPHARERLMQVRDRMKHQRQTMGYIYWGKYSPELQGEMDEVQRQCDTSLLVSEEVVNRYPAPELYALMTTYTDKRRSDAVNYNLDGRNLADDWARAWLADEPIQTTPTPTVDTVP